MTIKPWTLCAAVILGSSAGCGSVKALSADAAAGSSAEPGSEGQPHPDAGVLLDAGVPPDATGTPAPPPPGPTKCSGTGCDNLDPTESVNASTGASCSAGATTATGGSVNADNGLLELRWGQNCQVNWARFTPSASGAKYRIWASRESPSASTDRYEFTTTAQLQEFSNQVYAPSAARACIEQWNGSSWVNQVCTPWI